MCLCENKYEGGGIAPFCGGCQPPLQSIARYGYRSDSIAVSRDMGPLRPCCWKLSPRVFLGMHYAENMHDIFLYCGQPESFSYFFLLFAGQDQLGENYLTYFFHIWGSRILWVKNMHYIFGTFQVPPINHVCDKFPPIRRLPKGWFWRVFPRNKNPERG